MVYYLRFDDLNDPNLQVCMLWLQGKSLCAKPETILCPTQTQESIDGDRRSFKFTL
jgi:hypothetical protein